MIINEHNNNPTNNTNKTYKYMYISMTSNPAPETSPTAGMRLRYRKDTSRLEVRKLGQWRPQVDVGRKVNI